MAPGSWVQAVDATTTIYSDAGSVGPDTALCDAGMLRMATTAQSGRSMTVVEDVTALSAIKIAGFVDIKERWFRLPLTRKTPGINMLGCTRTLPYERYRRYVTSTFEASRKHQLTFC
ncbi:hypothetical protein F4778DRAFT_595466 [Xylariomycetidae sp. FL2044]|nr:hypothetical protein F4778DRAFT_595466 [Xylariomycetidae sp. FL2044]